MTGLLNILHAWSTRDRCKYTKYNLFCQSITNYMLPSGFLEKELVGDGSQDD